MNWKLNITKEAVKGFVKSSSRAVLSVGAVLLPIANSLMKNYDSREQLFVYVGYDEAVSVITKSRMWSEDKAEAIVMLPQDADAGFYKAIIAIVNSSMWSEDKLEAIEEICKRRNAK